MCCFSLVRTQYNGGSTPTANPRHLSIAHGRSTRKIVAVKGVGDKTQLFSFVTAVDCRGPGDRVPDAGVLSFPSLGYRIFTLTPNTH